MDDKERTRMLGLTLSQIEKQFGKGSILRLGSKEAIVPVSVISSGAISLDAALGVEVVVPREAQLRDVVLGDLLERAVALLGVGATVGHPLRRLFLGVDQPLAALTYAHVDDYLVYPGLKHYVHLTAPSLITGASLPIM